MRSVLEVASHYGKCKFDPKVVIEHDERAQPMSGWEMRSFYSSTSIHSWKIDQMKTTLHGTTKWFPVDKNFEAVCWRYIFPEHPTFQDIGKCYSSQVLEVTLFYIEL